MSFSLVHIYLVSWSSPVAQPASLYWGHPSCSGTPLSHTAECLWWRSDWLKGESIVFSSWLIIGHEIQRWPKWSVWVGREPLGKCLSSEQEPWSLISTRMLLFLVWHPERLWSYSYKPINQHGDVRPERQKAPRSFMQSFA